MGHMGHMGLMGLMGWASITNHLSPITSHFSQSPRYRGDYPPAEPSPPGLVISMGSNAAAN
jgi:hypothetical protein